MLRAELARRAAIHADGGVAPCLLEGSLRQVVRCRCVLCLRGFRLAVWLSDRSGKIVDDGLCRRLVCWLSLRGRGLSGVDLLDRVLCQDYPWWVRVSGVSEVMTRHYCLVLLSVFLSD